VFNVPCYRPADLELEAPWIGSEMGIGKTVRFMVIKTDMSQKVPFILGDLLEDQSFDDEDPLESKVSFFWSIFYIDWKQQNLHFLHSWVKLKLKMNQLIYLN